MISSKLIHISFIKSFEYKLNYLLSIFFSLIPLIVQNIIWKALNSNNSDGIIIQNIMLYFIIGQIIRNIISTRTAMYMFTDYTTGSIVLKYIFPIKYDQYYLFSTIGNSLFQLLFVSLPLFLIAIPLFSIKLSFMSILSFRSIFFITSILLSFLINFYLFYIIGLLSFQIKDNSGLFKINSVLNLIFSGLMIPLYLFPQWVNIISTFLPYRYITYSPIMIAISPNINRSSSIEILVKQLIVLILIYIICMFFDKKLKYKIDIFGG